MFVSTKRLDKLLNPDGFKLLFSNKHTKEICFVRNSRSNSLLYEHLLISGQGKLGEAVYAETIVAVVRNFPVSKLVAETDDHELLYELETDKERHWTLLDSTNDAKIWERRLANVASLFAERNAEKRGLGLLTRLSRCIADITNYRKLIGDPFSIFDREYAYFMDSSSADRNEAERIAANTFVLNWAYDDVKLACLILVKYGTEVEQKSEPWRDVKPLDSPENLHPKILLLSDYISSQRTIYENL